MVLSLYIRALLFLNLHTFSQFIRLFFFLFPLNPASSRTHFVLSHFTLFLCYLTTLAAMHKMAAGSWELEGTEWKPFSNSFRTMHREREGESSRCLAGSSDKSFLRMCAKRLSLFYLFIFFLMCCANKAIGTLAFLKKRDKGTTHYDFNLFQAHIIISLTKRKKIHVDKAGT